MRPYVLEGLDCSGKKTVAAELYRLLAEQGVPVTLVVGPLAGGPLSTLDRRLAEITRPVCRGSTTDRFRRAVYVLEPSLDRIAAIAARRHTVKVSSHFRAWARALLECDHAMARAFAATAAAHVRFAGATLLHTDFAVRLRRHHADVEAGRTTKVAERRFFGPDQDSFDRWDRLLTELMGERVAQVQQLDSTATTPEALAGTVAEHAIACWGAQP